MEPSKAGGPLQAIAAFEPNQLIKGEHMASVRLKPGALAAALLLSATAQAAPISSAAVTIDGLRYQLIDLNPDDGIAASVTFTDPTWTGRQTYYETPEWYSGPVLMQQNMMSGTAGVFGTGAPLTGTSTDGTIQYGMGPGSIALSGQLDSSTALGQPYVNQYGYSYTTQDESGQWYRHDVSSSSYSLDVKNTNGATVNTSDDAAGTYGSHFTLSANTALVLMGTAKLDIEADRSNMQAMKADVLAQIGPDAANSSFKGSGYLQVGLNLSMGSTEAELYSDGTFYGGIGGQASFVMMGSMYYNSLGFIENSPALFEDEDVIIDAGLTRQRAITKDFALTYVNSLDKDADMLFGAEMSVGLTEDFYGTGYVQNPDVVVPIDPPVEPPPVVPGVPEPGTYAMMGLGLAGLLLARRRAHQG